MARFTATAFLAASLAAAPLSAQEAGQQAGTQQPASLSSASLSFPEREAHKKCLETLQEHETEPYAADTARSRADDNLGYLLLNPAFPRFTPEFCAVLGSTKTAEVKKFFERHGYKVDTIEDMFTLAHYVQHNDPALAGAAMEKALELRRMRHTRDNVQALMSLLTNNELLDGRVLAALDSKEAQQLDARFNEYRLQHLSTLQKLHIMMAHEPELVDTLLHDTRLARLAAASSGNRLADIRRYRMYMERAWNVRLVDSFAWLGVPCTLKDVSLLLQQQDTDPLEHYRFAQEVFSPSFHSFLTYAREKTGLLPLPGSEARNPLPLQPAVVQMQRIAYLSRHDARGLIGLLEESGMPVSNENYKAVASLAAGKAEPYLRRVQALLGRTAFDHNDLNMLADTLNEQDVQSAIMTYDAEQFLKMVQPYRASPLTITELSAIPKLLPYRKRIEKELPQFFQPGSLKSLFVLYRVVPELQQLQQEQQPKQEQAKNYDSSRTE